MKKIISILTIVSLSVSALFADVISPELFEKVKEKGELQNIFLNDNEVKLSLVPDTELSKLAITHWNNSDKPRLTTEKLFYLDKKTIGSKENSSEENINSSNLSIEDV